VTEDDVSGVTLSLRPALTFGGRVRFDGAAAPPADLATVRVTLSPVGQGGSVAVNATVFGQRFGASGSARADGSFDVAGVLPGPYTVSATVPAGAGAPWRLASAIVGGRDVLDDPLLVSDGNVTGAVLTFTDRRTEIAGRLRDAANQPALDYVVVVFSAERQFWRAGSRRTKFMRPSSDGQFAFADLPKGDYLLAALEDVDAEDLHDPAFLDQIAAASVKVTLGDAGIVRQDLRIAR
jgi:hypothetical protein